MSCTRQTPLGTWRSTAKTEFLYKTDCGQYSNDYFIIISRVNIPILRTGKLKSKVKWSCADKILSKTSPVYLP